MSVTSFTVFSIAYHHVNLNLNNVDTSKTLYIITPTHNGYGQIPHLTRLGITLRQVRNIHWLVVEDAPTTNPNIEALLRRSNVKYTYLHAETDRKSTMQGRGVEQRNCALDYISKLNPVDGLVYFADDDNTYDLELFKVLRRTKYCGVLPVGLLGQMPYESFEIMDGKVVGFYAAFGLDRKFQIDMAGFVVHVSALTKNNPPRFKRTPLMGVLETDFLEQVVTNMSQLEPIAYDFDRILVWHTKTQNIALLSLEQYKSNYGSNRDMTRFPVLIY
ncbi:galactosylgalactosylxylosylprotein 3-beta-glucuronosyltransferase [Acrasis kona]|uniref:Galactosylgalactosylxylosylprotein 3-beta-glucuronosyltransferase n=1 Tax=Acrasis kona TaxID=1008807 RepID=A0AAW2YTM0_9EUKA